MRTRAALGVLAALAAACCLASCGGCVSMPLAPRPPAGESTLLFPAVVGIEPGDPPRASEELLRCLRATGLFASVEAVDRPGLRPDLLARVEGTGAGTAAIPILTVFSLGLIPTVVEEHWGLAFSLRCPVSPEPSLAIDARWSGRTILGWAGMAANLSPDRSSELPTAHPRHVQHVAALLAAHASEIDALLATLENR